MLVMLTLQSAARSLGIAESQLYLSKTFAIENLMKLEFANRSPIWVDEWTVPIANVIPLLLLLEQ